MSGPSGSGGEAIDTVPIFDSAGQLTASRFPLASWGSLQALRPLAAEGLRPIPVGSATRAVLVWELSCLSPPRMCGTSTSTLAPIGESVAAVPGSTASSGS